jgi:hypothetical protein
MKSEKHDYQNVNNRIPVQTQCPIRAVVFGQKIETGQNFDADQNNQCQAADAVKKPDEHIFPLYD